jgi:capsular exopolysaccharide synthesis family protein
MRPSTAQRPTRVVATRGSVGSAREEHHARTESLPGITASAVLHGVLRCWRTVLPLAMLLAGLAGAVVWARFRPTYQASAWLQIQQSSPYLAFAMREGHDEVGRFFETQTELIRSPIVLEQVAADPDVARISGIDSLQDRIEWLHDGLAVRPVGRSELWTVSYEDYSPRGAAEIVNAVVDAYVRQRETQEAKHNQRVLELLEQERTRRTAELGRMRQEVRGVSQQMTPGERLAEGVDPSLRGLDPTVDMQRQLVSLAVEQEVLQAQITAMEESQGKRAVRVPAEMLARAVDEDPEVQRLKRSISTERAKLEEVKRVLVRGENDPAYRALERRIAGDEAALARLRTDLRKDQHGELEQRVLEKQRDEVAALRLELQAREVRQRILRERYRDELPKAQAGSERSLDLQFRRAELNQAQQVLDLITMRAAQLRTEQQAPSRVVLLKRAAEPVSPVRAFPYRNFGLATFGAFCFPFVLVVFRERVLRRIIEPAELEHETQLPVLGEIARLPRALNGLALAGGPPTHVSRHLLDAARAFEESVDAVRTGLLVSDELAPNRILAVTSATVHEGKTRVATALAASIARASGHAVLLVDGDMRCPEIHARFGIARQPGLAEVLRGEIGLDEAIVRPEGGLVHVLPAGAASGNPHELLGTEAIKEVLRDAAASYAYVIVDTSPVLAAAESLVLAKLADACVLCALRHVSRGDQIRRACQRLNVAGTRVLGAVLNGMPRSRYPYYYPHPRFDT